MKSAQTDHHIPYMGQVTVVHFSLTHLSIQVRLHYKETNQDLTCFPNTARL